MIYFVNCVASICSSTELHELALNGTIVQASVDSRMHLCLKVVCQARDGHRELMVQDLQLLEYSMLVFVLSSQQDHQVKLLVCDIIDTPVAKPTHNILHWGLNSSLFPLLTVPCRGV